MNQSKCRGQRLIHASGFLAASLMLVSGAILFGGQQGQAPVEETDAEPAILETMEPVKLTDLTPHLVRLMRAGVDVLEPNASFTKGEKRETLFAGSYDWHSCVIAYWALLVHARVHKDVDLAEWVLARLTPESLLMELEALQGRNRKREITYPYDEAWFAMLLAEVATHLGAKADPLLKPRQELEARLLKTLEGSDFPENLGAKDDQVLYCGFYRSVLFHYLCMRWTEPCLPNTSARLDQWAQTVLERNRAAIESIRDSHGYDFLSVPALLALVDRLDSKGEDIPPYQPNPFEGWPESVEIRTVHILGLELTRVWPLAIDAARGDIEALGVYQTRVESLTARPELWSQDFPACSHWVPQYLFLGEWLRAGRP